MRKRAPRSDPASILGTRQQLTHAQEKIVHAASEYIHAHYQNPLTIARVAHTVGRSPSWLRQQFRMVYGVTPRAYLDRVRLDQARHLLTQSDLLVKQIAREIGFTSTRAFRRRFHREESVSPQAYRERGARIRGGAW